MTKQVPICKYCGDKIHKPYGLKDNRIINVWRHSSNHIRCGVNAEYIAEPTIIELPKPSPYNRFLALEIK